MTTLASAGAALLGGSLASAERLAGGDLSEVVRIVLTDGRRAVVKGGPAPRTEAAMLAAIAAASVPAPTVLAVDDTALVLAEIEGRSGVGSAWHDLGVVLARLHATRGGRYGWPEPYAFGALAIDNSWTEDWPEFWARRRLLVHAGHVDGVLARRIERLADALTDRLPAHPPVALLHGDLWGGNVMTRKDRVAALIDPACYHGHAEVDLAMLALFDRPPAAFFESYGALEPGRAERRPIYQLWPALVHLRLFGAGYRGLVDRLLSEAGA